MNTRFAIAMARRETRTSARRLALYGSCMALGIAALVGLDGLRASVTDALGEQAQRLLGAAKVRRAFRDPERSTPWIETGFLRAASMVGEMLDQGFFVEGFSELSGIESEFLFWRV